MDLTTGKSEMLFSIADIAKIPNNGQSVENNWHWFNHLLISPDSKRFMFLNRWRTQKDERQKKNGSRRFFYPDGTKVIIDSPHCGDGRQMYLIDIGSLVDIFFGAFKSKESAEELIKKIKVRPDRSNLKWENRWGGGENYLNINVTIYPPPSEKVF